MFFDYSKCYDRLYYLKRLNKNAILIAAFYSRELSDALTASDDMSELQSYLVDEDYNILYSDNEKSIGKNAVDVIADVTMGYDNYQLIGDENLIVQGKCENNWRVICAAPVKVIFSEDLHDTEKGTPISDAARNVLDEEDKLVGYEKFADDKREQNTDRLEILPPIFEKKNIYDSFKTNADYYLYGKKSKEEVVDAIVESFYK